MESEKKTEIMPFKLSETLDNLEKGGFDIQVEKIRQEMIKQFPKFSSLFLKTK